MPKLLTLLLLLISYTGMAQLDSLFPVDSGWRPQHQQIVLDTIALMNRPCCPKPHGPMGHGPYVVTEFYFKRGNAMEPIPHHSQYGKSHLKLVPMSEIQQLVAKQYGDAHQSMAIVKDERLQLDPVPHPEERTIKNTVIESSYALGWPDGKSYQFYTRKLTLVGIHGARDHSEQLEQVLAKIIANPALETKWYGRNDPRPDPGFYPFNHGLYTFYLVPF